MIDSVNRSYKRRKRNLTILHHFILYFPSLFAKKLEIGELKAVKSAENLLSIAKDSLQFSSEPVESAVRPFFDEEPAPLRDVGSQNSSSSVSSTQRRTDLKVPKRLGEEFEFAAVIKEAEPDFFADMMPDLSKKTVLVEKKGTLINSKFEAVDDEVWYS